MHRDHCVCCPRPVAEIRDQCTVFDARDDAGTYCSAVTSTIYERPSGITRHVEIAKVFDAPLLASANCNGTAAQLLDQVGSKGVRYGEIRQPNGEDIDAAVSLRWRKHKVNRATFIVSQVDPRATWLRLYPCLTLSFGICGFFQH
jgi:hypothetical protein